MKRLFKAAIALAIFMFTTSAMAIEPDKQAHLELSFFLGAAFYSVYEVYHCKRDAYLLSVLSVMVMGGAKELLYDDKPDGKDMQYNLMGAMTGPLLPILIFSY